MCESLDRSAWRPARHSHFGVLYRQANKDKQISNVPEALSHLEKRLDYISKLQSALVTAAANIEFFGRALSKYSQGNSSSLESDVDFFVSKDSEMKLLPLIGPSLMDDEDHNAFIEASKLILSYTSLLGTIKVIFKFKTNPEENKLRIDAEVTKVKVIHDIIRNRLDHLAPVTRRYYHQTHDNIVSLSNAMVRELQSARMP